MIVLQTAGRLQDWRKTGADLEFERIREVAGRLGKSEGGWAKGFSDVDEVADSGELVRVPDGIPFRTGTTVFHRYLVHQK